MRKVGEIDKSGGGRITLSPGDGLDTYIQCLCIDFLLRALLGLRLSCVIKL